MEHYERISPKKDNKGRFISDNAPRIKRIKKECDNPDCDVIIELTPYRFGLTKHHFCSLECRNKSSKIFCRTDQLHTPQAIQKMANKKKGKPSWNKGVPMKESSRKKMIASKTKLSNEERQEHRYQSQLRYYNKKKSEPQYRINMAMSQSIYASLSGKKDYRKWMELAGYTLEDLMTHLESQFAESMTWNNYGHGVDKWNIDHIIPKNLWEYENPQDREFKQCWALANLQPMWMSDNCRKRDRIQSVETLHEAYPTGYEEKVRHSQGWEKR